ncbi:MAG TPA: MFS transporter, partial [Roseiarcus sp.]|nr:MFS transporter [Roseiarcus sp.]
YLHDARVADGVPRDHVYDAIFYALTGLLVVGLVANALVRPVADKWFINAPAEHERHAAAPRHSSFGIGYGGFDAQAAVAWALVGLPLAWGVYMTLLSAVKIFH